MGGRSEREGKAARFPHSVHRVHAVPGRAAERSVFGVHVGPLPGARALSSGLLFSWGCPSRRTSPAPSSGLQEHSPFLLLLLLSRVPSAPAGSKAFLQEPLRPSIASTPHAPHGASRAPPPYSAAEGPFWKGVSPSSQALVLKSVSHPSHEEGRWWGRGVRMQRGN